VLSILIAGTGICSSLLANQGISLPTCQSALNYVFLCVYFTCRRGPLRAAWWKYLVLALVDVEANFLVSGNISRAPQGVGWGV
jgi:solute carrier family 35, member F1/2